MSGAEGTVIAAVLVDLVGGGGSEEGATIAAVLFNLDGNGGSGGGVNPSCEFCLFM